MMLRSLVVLGVALVTSPTARAACTIDILWPVRPIPNATKGQWFEFLASGDCTKFVFSANGGAFTKEASFVESTDAGDVYEVRASPSELQGMTNYVTTLHWSITGFGIRPSEMVQVSTTSEIDLDRDGWTRSEGDVGSCDMAPLANPSMTEICGNRVDDDCNGTVDDC